MTAETSNGTNVFKHYVRVHIGDMWVKMYVSHHMKESVILSEHVRKYVTVRGKISCDRYWTVQKEGPMRTCNQVAERIADATRDISDLHKTLTNSGYTPIITDKPRSGAVLSAYAPWKITAVNGAQSLGHKPVGEWRQGEWGIYYKKHLGEVVCYIPPINYIGTQRSDAHHPNATYDNWIVPQAINYDVNNNAVIYRDVRWKYVDDRLWLDTGIVFHNSRMGVADYIDYVSKSMFKLQAITTQD